MNNFIHSQNKPKGQRITDSDSEKPMAKKVIKSGDKPEHELLNKKKKIPIIHV